MARVLFICTGNTCRSPMAESLLKKMAIPGVEVRSAGIYAVNGSDASTNAKKVLDEQQIPHYHQSTLLSESLAEWADYILTMTSGHKSTVVQLFPQAIPKTYTLNEFASLDEKKDIGDPFGGSVDIYRITFMEIKKAIENITEKLKKNT